MTYLNPTFLFGLLLVVLPLIITLLIRKRYQSVRIPSLRFFKLVTVTRKKFMFKWHDWLVLIVRVGIVSALCLLFAKPVVPLKGDQMRRTKVVVFDDSLSMAIDGAYQRCQQHILSYFKELPTQQKVVLFFVSGLKLESENISTEFISTVKNHPVTHAGFRPEKQFKRVSAYVNQNSKAVDSVLFFTDLRKNGWEKRVSDQALPIEKPIRIIDCAEPHNNNMRTRIEQVTISGPGNRSSFLNMQVSFVTEATRSSKIKFVVKLMGHDKERYLNPIIAGTYELAIKTNALLRKNYQINLPENLNKVKRVFGFVEIINEGGQPQVTLDDRFYFVAAAKRPMIVEIADGSFSNSIYNQQSLYVIKALSLLQNIQVERYTQSQFYSSSAVERDSADMLILLDPTFSDNQFWKKVAERLKAGGHVFLTFGENFNLADAQQRFKQLGFKGQVNDIVQSGNLVLQVDTTHQWQQRVKLRSIDFKSTQISRMVQLASLKSDQIIWYNGEMPLFTLFDSFAGKLFVYTSSFHRKWSNVAIKPVFPVFWQKMMRYISEQRRQKAQQTGLIIGENLSRDTYVSLAPQQQPDKTWWLMPENYFLGGDPVAVNLDYQELDSTRISFDYLKGLFASRDITLIPVQKLNQPHLSHMLLESVNTKSFTYEIVLILAVLLLLESLYFLVKNLKMGAGKKVMAFIIGGVFLLAPGTKVKADSPPSFRFSNWDQDSFPADPVDSKFRITFLVPKSYQNQSVVNENPLGIPWFISEMTRRTSIDSDSHVTQSNLVDDLAQVFRTPFLYFEGKAQFKEFSAEERKIMRMFLRSGGTLFVDDTTNPSAQQQFDQVIRQEIKLILPEEELKALSLDHAIYRSFYLIKYATGLNEVFPRLEGIDINEEPVVIYNRNNLFGAYIKQNKCVPGGERQREMAVRLGINLIMYLLTSNYKNDQIHLPEILKRTR